ncbi:MAG: C39 family peptidase [Spirochaetales bacterium]|nr:C39 family peptidase [Spirochaetales bacterium]
MLTKNHILKAFIIIVTILLLVSTTFTYSTKYFESELEYTARRVSLNQGQERPDRVENRYYFFVQKNQSVHDVAAELKCSVYDLLLYNQLTGYNPLSAGQRLIISRRLFQIKNHQKLSVVADKLPKGLMITASDFNGSAPLMVKFKANNVDLDDYLYIWDFGNNRYSFEKNPQHVYTRSGDYKVRLIIYNREFEQLESNSIILSISKIKAEYTGPDYLVVDRVGDVLNLQCRMTDKDGFPVDILPGAEIVQYPALIRQIARNKFIADGAGYSQITITQGENQYHFYLFVSPFPSKLSVDPEYDWYFTQFDTGMRGNCGPASNSMAIRWATGKNYSVEEVRKEIGIPYVGGGVDYGNLLDNLKTHNVKTELVPFDNPKLIFDNIDQGKIMILLFDTKFITPVSGDKTRNYTGRYYRDATGHYIVVKGYTLDKKYLIVYDAIPGDWYQNEPRYQDRVSMIGRNRYFLVKDMMRAIKIPEILVINRSGA